MTNSDFIQRRLDFINAYKNSSNASTGSKYDANANVTTKNIATMGAEIGKYENILLQREVMKNYLTKMYDSGLAEQYIKDLDHHIIYRHDETSSSGGFPYCCAISLYPFLLNGLTEIGGTSQPPKHVDSYIGGLINLIFLVAGQFVGAVAIPETLTYMDHFLRIDYGNDYIDHLDDAVDLRRNNPRTLRQRIHDWFQQLVFTINQPAGARGYQSVFFNIAYFDKYYFESLFDNFVFPDGDIPCWETTKELQKLFMRWFNEERTKAVITFPVESFNLLVDKETGEYKDKESADFAAEMWSKGHSFFMYQSDSADSLSSCCRLRNGIEENVFSYTLGAGGVETGSKAVITLNLNRIVQDWFKVQGTTLKEYIYALTHRVHQYLEAFNEKLWDDMRAGILGVYNAGFIDLDKQYLTIGINGFIEAAEFLGIKIDPEDDLYKAFAKDILGTIEQCNKDDRTEHCKYNLEFVPGENLGHKNYKWDKEDGYVVPKTRSIYNSYFYPVEDAIDPVKKFYYQGHGFADVCSGGVALHNNLDEHLSQAQYRMLMDVAVRAGCNYFTFNIPNTECKKCGHIDKRFLKVCPKCGSVEVDYLTRVIGYLKRVSNFSEARQEEASKRYYGKIKSTE